MPKKNKTEVKELTKAIYLPSFGDNKMYRYAAYNAAFSIKKHLSEPIAVYLITDHPQWCKDVFGNTFDGIIPLSEPPILNGRFDPGFVKTTLYKYLNTDICLLLDVDVLCIGDLAPAFSHFQDSGKSLMSYMSGTFTLKDGDKSLTAMNWAKAKDVFEHWELAPDTIVPAINSSILFIRKNDEAEAVYKMANDYFVNNPIDNSLIFKTWGKTHPDELYFNAAMAKLGVDPSGMQDLIFFNYGKKSKSFKEIREQHVLCSYYGGRGFTFVGYIEWFDDLLIKWHYELGINPKMKVAEIIKKKYVDIK